MKVWLQVGNDAIFNGKRDISASLWLPSNGIMHTAGCGSANGIKLKLPVCIKTTLNDCIRTLRKAAVRNVTFHFYAFMYPFYCIFLCVHMWHLQRLNLYNIIFNHQVLVFVLTSSSFRRETNTCVGLNCRSRPERNAAAPHVASIGGEEDKAD